MIYKINPNQNIKISIGYKDSFDWQCQFCGQIHHETQLRNFQRRKNKCSCQDRQNQIIYLQARLKEVNYIFLEKEKNNATLLPNKKIDTKKPILVKCLKCGKISMQYYNNLIKEHKKCNCNQNKKFTRNFSTEDFIKKWHPLNQERFELLEGEHYINRNFKYKIRCKKCKEIDERWGISLIDNPISCKYCDNITTGEAMISSVLNKNNIFYEREYVVYFNAHQHRFDFFVPKYKTFIEYNGLQHYKSIEYFGGEKQFKKRQERDKEKQQYCDKKGYKLLIFSYQSKYEEIEKRISSMFNDYPEREYTISD